MNDNNNRELDTADLFVPHTLISLSLRVEFQFVMTLKSFQIFYGINFHLFFLFRSMGAPLADCCCRLMRSINGASMSSTG